MAAEDLLCRGFGCNECSLKAKDPQDFGSCAAALYTDYAEMMEDRIHFLVETSAFFKANFLVTEGFVKLENFTGMFGMVGLAECVNHLLHIDDPKQGYGNNPQADDLGAVILQRLSDLVAGYTSAYCDCTDHHFRLHAQVGIDSDGRENSPGARIPVGAEPGMLKQIQHAARMHGFFPTGIGDIFKFEETWLNTPEALGDIIKGAIESGMRYFSAIWKTMTSCGSLVDLVKKSELAKPISISSRSIMSAFSVRVRGIRQRL
ncbi:MAG: glycyl radical enzyme domain-containing protein [Holdemania massiliensis]